MANKKYKLTDGNMWATDGIHDFGQNKTQRTINSEVNTALGGKAPTNHASTSTTYGKGTSSNYGHVKISDSLTDTTPAATGGVVPSMKAVSDLNGAISDEATARANADTALQNAITSVENGIAIVANGNTHAAITKRQYVYIKGHGTLSDGLYTATTAIPLNGTLSSSNVAFVTDGGLNAIQTIIGHLNSIDTLVITPSTNVYTNSFYFNYVGNAIVPTGYFNATENLQNNATVMTVNKAPKDVQSILAVGLNSHLAYVLTYGATGAITAPEGLPSGYYRMIATVIVR